MSNRSSIIANGTINPACFIKLDATADHAAVACAASTDRPFGISVDASHDAPIPGYSGAAAAAGQEFNYFGVGEEATLTLGTGGCAAADILVSDASGNGVVASAISSSSPVWIGAEALEAGNAGEKVRVVVRQISYGA